MARCSAKVLLCFFLSASLMLPMEVGIAQKKKASSSTVKRGTVPVHNTSTKSGGKANKKKSSSRAQQGKTRSSNGSRSKNTSAKSTARPKKQAGKARQTTSKHVPSTKKSASASGKARGSSVLRRAASSTSSSAPSVQQPRSVRLKQDELKRIRNDIREYENRLAESRRTERGTLERIDMYDRQTALIRQVVSHLRGEIDDNQHDIHQAARTLEEEETRLRGVKAAYARSIVNAYKRGRMHDTELLLSSTSLNQMLIRSRYLRAFSSRQRRSAAEIRERQEAITAQKMLLEAKVNEQRKRVTEKTSQEQVLQRKVGEHKNLLEKVREDKNAYAAELKRKQAAAAKIERLIADLIEREQAKRLEASRSTRSSSTSKGNRSASSSRDAASLSALPSRALSETAFGRLKGRLPWPLSQGRVIGGFGEQINPKHGTVTISNGIDIAAESGSSVRVVADGTVSVVYFIAGYGNLVIVNHDDGFRTVYAHLTSISVRTGQRVKAGQSIASSGEGLSGPQIHFELWREKAVQNPLRWLSGR